MGKESSPPFQLLKNIWQNNQTQRFFNYASELPHHGRLQHPNPKRRICLWIRCLARRARTEILAGHGRSRQLTLWQTHTPKTKWLDTFPLAAGQSMMLTMEMSASTTKHSRADARGATNTQSLFLRRNGLKPCESVKPLASLRSTRSCRTWATITWTFAKKSVDTLNPNL